MIASMLMELLVLVIKYGSVAAGSALSLLMAKALFSSGSDFASEAESSLIAFSASAFFLLFTVFLIYAWYHA